MPNKTLIDGHFRTVDIRIPICLKIVEQSKIYSPIDLTGKPKLLQVFHVLLSCSMINIQSINVSADDFLCLTSPWLINLSQIQGFKINITQQRYSLGNGHLNINQNKWTFGLFIELRMTSLWGTTYDWKNTENEFKEFRLMLAVLF